MGYHAQIHVINKLLNPQSRNGILLNSNKAKCLFHSISYLNHILGRCLAKFPVLLQTVFENEWGLSCSSLGGVADNLSSSQYGKLCFSTEHFTCQFVGFKWVPPLSCCYILIRPIVLFLKIVFWVLFVDVWHNCCYSCKGRDEILTKFLSL